MLEPSSFNPISFYIRIFEGNNWINSWNERYWKRSEAFSFILFHIAYLKIGFFRVFGFHWLIGAMIRSHLTKSKERSFSEKAKVCKTFQKSFIQSPTSSFLDFARVDDIRFSMEKNFFGRLKSFMIIVKLKRCKNLCVKIGL